MASYPIKVLVIGQTPPPYHGQAMMIQRLVNAKFRDIEIQHIRLAFSDEVKKIGKISLYKIIHLFSIILKVYRARLSNEKLILYYPPAGPDLTPIVRDLILLFFIKPFFFRSVYHFRAAGISDYLKGRSDLFQFICRRIYGKPDAGIQLSSLNPKDADYFQAKKIFYIPNGLEDSALPYLPIKKQSGLNVPVNILFVGVLREDKGLTCLINALHILSGKGTRNFKLTVMGDFTSPAYKEEMIHKIEILNLKESVSFAGVQTGSSKWDHFIKADLFCFPTFYKAESFGNVLLEAMMFQLPVVATEWRGIPDIVTKEVGFLVPVKDEEMLADKLNLLIMDPALRLEMGQNARRLFLEKYTLQQHLNQMENMFHSVKL